MPDRPETTYGRHPTDANGQAQGPYAHVSGTPGTFGSSMGAGLLHGPVGGEGNQANASVLSANLGLGKFQDASGRTNYGVGGDAALARFGIDPGNGLGPLGFDVGTLTANAGALANDSTASLGAQANLIEGSASLGNQEHLLRVGGSVGVGLAGRLHYGDADDDGTRELGLGFDAGPFSMDVKSELLGRAWNGIKSAGASVGNAASGVWDRITSW